MPSSFLRKTQKEEEEESKKFKNYTQRNIPGMASGPASVTTPSADKSKSADEELEIPAFIRRKMGI